MQNRITCVMAIAFGIVPTTAMANCLDDVSSFAEKICGKIQIDGHSTTTEISGEIEADLSGMILKFLGKTKVSMDGKRVTEAYKNVLRNDLPKELMDIRQCRIKMVEIGRSELCKSAAAEIQNKRYVADPQDNFPGVAISYPASLVEKEADTGVPRLLPLLNSKEARAELEVQIVITSMIRAGVEESAGITLPVDKPRYPEGLTSAEHLKLIKYDIQQIHDGRAGFAWVSEHPTKISVYSDSKNPPGDKITEDGWIVDYVEGGRRFRELHFFQQTSEYQAPADSFGLITVSCSALEKFFDSVQEACNKVLDGTVAISSNYFSD